MGEGKCYSCGETFPYSQLKRCSQCLFVRYCSRDCQKKAWIGGHNKSCRPHPHANKTNLEKFSNDWIELEADKALSRWLDIWRAVLCEFAVISLDLPNHPTDYNATHMMVLWVCPRMLMDDPAQSYGVVRGEVWPLERCETMWPEIGFIPAKNMEDNRFRVVIVLENYKGETRGVRMFTWQTHRGTQFRKIDKETSRALASGWLDVLANTIQAGEVEMAKKNLKVT